MKKSECVNFGMAPFWFWNGDMADEEIICQIRECHEKGIGGFFIHPRQGLTVPYLSEQWFEKVKLAVGEAKRNHLDVWIYDEYPYPSGISGGEVILEHPEYEAKRLEPVCIDVDGNREVSIDLPWGQVIAAVAYPLRGKHVEWDCLVDLTGCIGICRSEKIFQNSGLTAYNSKRFFEGNLMKRLRCTLGAGYYRIYVFVETVLDHMKFYDHFVDPLMPGAVDCFIETTHEQYKKHVGEEFGKTIKGFFSDEIDLSPQNEPIRWSSCLPELFKQRYGYSLIEWLPALIEPMGEGTDRFRYDYRNLMVDRFIHCYDKRIQDWCHRNNLLYVAEKPVLRSSQLQYLDIPGCDTGHQKVYSTPDIMKAKYRANPKLVSSAAHFYQKDFALCECFHSIGWSMNMQDMKWIIDLLAVYGINMVVPHAFFYTTDGLTKHDAPPSSFFQQPYWADMGGLTSYVRRLCEIMSGGNRQVDILVLDPIGSQWTAIAEKEALGKKLADDFLHLQKAMLQNHLDYYIIDSDILEQFEVRDGKLWRSGEKYEMLILPPMTNMEKATAQCIMEFIEKGVLVISVGCLPVERIDEADTPTLLEKLFMLDTLKTFENYRSAQPIESGQKSGRNRARFVSNADDLPDLLARNGFHDFSVITQGHENPDILGIHYRKSDKEFYFFVNSFGKSYGAQICLKGQKASQVQQLSLEDGSMRPVKLVDGAPGTTFISTEFAPFESQMFCVDKNATVSDHPDVSVTHPATEKVLLDANEKIWDLKIAGSNALRLGRFQLSIESSGNSLFPDPIRCGEVACEPIINQVMDCRTRLPVQVVNYFGCPQELTFPELQCRYSVNFISEAGIGPVYLVTEPGGIEGEWQLSVNGHHVCPERFVRREFYLASNLAAEITPWMTVGCNTIELTIHTRKPSDGLVNPLYLFGCFGAFPSKENGSWKLTELPSQGTLADMAGCGFPFYAGERILSGQFEIAEAQDVVIRLANYMDNDSVTLMVNAQPAGIRSWEPYAFTVGAGLIKPGKNMLELHVRSTLLGLFEGKKFDQHVHKYVDFG